MKKKRISHQEEVDQSRTIALDLDQDQGAVRILDEEDDVQVQEAEEHEDQEAHLREEAVDQEAALFEEVGDPEVHLQDVVSVHQPLNQLKSI